MPMNEYGEIIRKPSSQENIPPANYNNNRVSIYYIILGVTVLVAVIVFFVVASSNNKDRDTLKYDTEEDSTTMEIARNGNSEKDTLPEAASEHLSSLDEYILPNSDSEYISYSELSVLTKEEVALARNEIFARRGRRFKNDSLREYFESKSWYNPTYDPDDFPDSVFNKYEKENINTIVEYEAEKGWN